MSISLTEARSLFTKATLTKWHERVSVSSFLRAFGTEKTTTAKYISVETKRGNRLIAVDVLRGSDPSMNKSTRASERMYEPPYFHEGFTNNELDIYDKVFDADGARPAMMQDLVNEVIEN